MAERSWGTKLKTLTVKNEQVGKQETGCCLRLDFDHRIVVKVAQKQTEKCAGAAGKRAELLQLATEENEGDDEKSKEDHREQQDERK